MRHVHQVPRSARALLGLTAFLVLPVVAVAQPKSLPPILGTWDLVLRKIAHTAEYALLGALLYRAVRHVPAALLVASAYAVTDEFHQTFVAGRHGSPVDWLIDTAGAAIGVAIAVRIWR